MTDAEIDGRVRELVVELILRPNPGHHAAILFVLKEVRRETARACAELCDNRAAWYEAAAFSAQFNPERGECTNRQAGAETCAAAIRGNFNLYRPPSTGGEGGERT